MEFNAYYKEMKKKLDAYFIELHAAEEEKDRALELYGWGEEVDRYYERRDAIIDSCPYNRWQVRAFQFLRSSKSEVPVFYDYCWDEEIHDFIDVLRNCGVKEFITTNQSTALMDNIRGFIEEGCSLLGFCYVKEDDYYSKSGFVEIPGLKFKV